VALTPFLAVLVTFAEEFDSFFRLSQCIFGVCQLDVVLVIPVVMLAVPVASVLDTEDPHYDYGCEGR
jgi:hypothetical protein